MAGGNLESALRRDMAERGDGPNRRLGWYARGRNVLLCVARGLAFLHKERVRYQASRAGSAVQAWNWDAVQAWIDADCNLCARFL